MSNWNKKIGALVKECPEIDSLLEGVHFIAEGYNKFEQIYPMFKEIGQHLPFDLILKLNSIAGFPIDEIEYNFAISGFDEWYKEKFGKTAEEAEEEAYTK